MAEYGKWNRKGATLSDVTAKKEFGVSRDFIVKGIRTGKLEYREGAVWGNPYLRILRRQLEQYIAEELGADRLSRGKNQTELRKIKGEMGALKKRLVELQARRTELEQALEKSADRTSPYSGRRRRTAAEGQRGAAHPRRSKGAADV